MNEIIVAIITGAFSLVGVVITCHVTSQKTKNEISRELRESHANLKQEFEVAKAITNEKIEELTRETRKHNNFAERMPVVENEIKHIKSDINKYHG